MALWVRLFYVCLVLVTEDDVIVIWLTVTNAIGLVTIAVLRPDQNNENTQKNKNGLVHLLFPCTSAIIQHVMWPDWTLHFNHSSVDLLVYRSNFTIGMLFSTVFCFQYEDIKE